MACLGRGGVACLGELSQRHRERVRRLAYRLLGRWDAAEDVAQEVFLRVQCAAGRYRPEARFTTWLHRVVVNLCHDAQRREQRQPGALPSDDSWAEPGVDDEPGAEMEATETAQRVAAAVRRLPDRQRTALVLHRYEELSHQQIAQITGWSSSAVESLIVRAYAQLREELADLQKT